MVIHSLFVCHKVGKTKILYFSEQISYPLKNRSAICDYLQIYHLSIYVCIYNFQLRKIRD